MYLATRRAFAPIVRVRRLQKAGKPVVKMSTTFGSSQYKPTDFPANRPQSVVA